LFDAVTRVTFDKNPEKKGTNEKVIKAIMQVSGKDEEAVTLNQVVKCEGNIEGWLKQLEVTMQNTLRDIARQASAQCFQLSLRDFARAYCSQIALLGIQIIWTFKITEALEKTGRNENKNIME
jgi:dynein heavy chain